MVSSFLADLQHAGVLEQRLKLGDGLLERDLARVRAAGLLLETSSYPDMLARLETAMI